ncbi:hypothetical protein BDQ17DRAFT_1000994 [Cyathus striatus]|nr:hypothetical protein BDQ17DRAFT_1000994 [Cyathus striatus]
MPWNPNAYPSFTGRHGKLLFGLAVGVAFGTWGAMIVMRDDVRQREGNIAKHKGEQGPDYISKEALEAVQPKTSIPTVKAHIRDARLR